MGLGLTPSGHPAGSRRPTKHSSSNYPKQGIKVFQRDMGCPQSLAKEMKNHLFTFKG
jgi:hypothetical protein